MVRGDASVLERADLQNFIVVYEHSTRGAMRTTNMDHDSLSNLLSSALRPSMQYKAPRRAREFLMFQPRCEPRVDYGGQAKVPRFKTRCKTHASCAEASRVCCMWIICNF